MKKILLAGAALNLVFAGAAYAEITIGVAGPMTGQYASFGEQLRTGAEQAVADINAKGGVNGEMLKLSVGDDACDPKQAVAVANQFASQGVPFVAGHFCSGSSIPASQVYNDEQIVQISPASTNPDFTDKRPGGGIFRVCGRDDQQGEVAGNYIAETFPDLKVAIINDKTAYGKGLADETQKTYEAAGKTPVLVESYTAGEKDYTALVTKMKEAGVGLVYVGGYHTEAGLMARQMREQGMDTILMSGDALVSDEYWAITGDAGQGTLMTFSPDPRKNEAAAPVVAELEKQGKTAEGYVLYTYAAIQAWADAVTKAGSTDYDPVVEALNANDFTTVIGDLKFDDKGDVTLPGYVLYEWKDGKYDYVETADAGGAMMKDDKMKEGMESMSKEGEKPADGADAEKPADPAGETTTK
ncbi:branched-chain amino acid ABC transporter substrate-binding protein [Aurantimonas sp. C2-6-R+9]|uniref:branched-chain amino acid ABC transporter substrate-binding protein n=1 Tax=unclassified Aurantimonas TaxID=2638230 RepID=UPI002E184909|nr:MULTISPECIES: branched-chain amino acid ABC transporter substrate-binding protein [unclassified Aurantimonas]MEC5291312.1 branched-chain amino acid ABC transporter substrate-binding protein [Aurantimonas sp. C2-3-R2]MEC5324305.1 branched-chain amino acid ABC transporter substrate-binding protein [Aurantimonas sp. A3-2-R12]MEC5381518.1 branched-chain amino acid ABC transporter substrate-binding protein [Aurantimonas sp. C2-6-R+9]MEC5412399.1 branched-chain amino acid ABC transporter substrate